MATPAPAATVVVVGLGPAGPDGVTLAADRALRTAPRALLRTARHPAAAAYVGLEHVRALDDCYEAGATFDDVYRQIADAVVAEARAHGRVVYAVPGSPAVAERTVELLRAAQAAATGAGRFSLEVHPAVSFAELAFARLGLDPVAAGVRLVDAERFAAQAAAGLGGVFGGGPLLVAQCWSPAVLSQVKLAFETEPDEPATLLFHLGLDDEQVVEVAWSEIDKTLEADHLTSLYVPSLGPSVASALVDFAELVRVLRERCPWDREQTHASLVRHLLEETYEAIEALEGLGDDPAEAPKAAVAHAEEELGDLLCQVFFHATLAEEEGLFTLGDVATAVHDKLVARHPHVFGDVEATTPDAVVTNWERIKQAEKQRTHLFEGVPDAMPALSRAAKAERKLASVGLGYDVTGRLPDALAATSDGALLLALARSLAHDGKDPEALLRAALAELAERVRRVEQLAGAGGADLGGLEPADRLGYWSEASDPS